MTTTTKRESPPQIDQLEMTEEDVEFANRVAARLGYELTAYTSSSALWGLFCLRDNPEHSGGHHAYESSGDDFDANCRKCGGKCRDSVHNLRMNYRTNGCIIKTKQFGFLFVADLEDMLANDLTERN